MDKYPNLQSLFKTKSFTVKKISVLETKEPKVGIVLYSSYEEIDSEDLLTLINDFGMLKIGVGEKNVSLRLLFDGNKIN